MSNEPPPDSDALNVGVRRYLHPAAGHWRGKVAPTQPPPEALAAVSAVIGVYEAALEVVATWTDPLDDDAHGTAVAALVAALERVGVLPP